MHLYDQLVPFLIAASIFAYVPGPAMLYTAAQTFARGKKAGYLAALGIHIGGYAHVLAAALGLTVVFQAIPILYSILKLAGGFYLIWLGLHMLRKSPSVAITRTTSCGKSSKRAFWESMIIELLNPKTAIFYLAFLPQFTTSHTELPLWEQLTILGCIVNLVFSSADILCVFLAERLIHYTAESKNKNLFIRRIGAFFLIALGTNLAFDKN